MQQSPSKKVITYETGADLAPGDEFVAAVVTMGAGAALDPLETPGLAHVTEHVLTFPLIDFPTHLRAQWSADFLTDLRYFDIRTGLDFTNFLFLSREKHLSEFSRFLEFFLFTDDVTAAKAETAKQQVIEERKRLLSHRVTGRTYQLLYRSAFRGHSYSRYTVGTGAGIRRITTDGLIRFKALHYRPENTTITIIAPARSKIETEQAVGNLDARLGSIFSINRPAPNPFVRKSQGPWSRILSSSNRKPHEVSALCLGIRTPPYQSPDIWIRQKVLTALTAHSGKLFARVFGEARDRSSIYFSPTQDWGLYEILFTFKSRSNHPHTPTQRFEELIEELGRFGSASQITDEEYTFGISFIKFRLEHLALRKSISSLIKLGPMALNQFMDTFLWHNAIRLISRRPIIPEEALHLLNGISKYDIARTAQNLYQPSEVFAVQTINT